MWDMLESTVSKFFSVPVWNQFILQAKFMNTAMTLSWGLNYLFVIIVVIESHKNKYWYIAAVNPSFL